MNMSDAIEKLLLQMLRESDGSVEIQRNNLAGELNCVPSQINYVITSRFNKERGYIVESRRGGGGYIRIIRPEMTGSEYLCHMLGCVGDSIDSESAVYLAKDMYAKGLINEREANIVISVLNNRNAYELAKEFSDYARAEMLKSIILTIIRLR